MGSSGTRARTRVPCIGRQIPIHCATREVPFCPFFNWVVFWCWVAWAVYICWVLTPYQSHRLQIFLPFSRLSFVLSVVSFDVQKLLSLIRSYLFIFAFVSFVLEHRFKKNWCDLCQRMFCLFYSRNFIVSCLKYRSLIHFEFIFVYGVRECSNFILLYVAVPCYQHLLLKRLSFLHCIVLPPLS